MNHLFLPYTNPFHPKILEFRTYSLKREYAAHSPFCSLSLLSTKFNVQQQNPEPQQPSLLLQLLVAVYFCINSLYLQNFQKGIQHIRHKIHHHHQQQQKQQLYLSTIYTHTYYKTVPLYHRTSTPDYRTQEEEFTNDSAPRDRTLFNFST